MPAKLFKRLLFDDLHGSHADTEQLRNLLSCQPIWMTGYGQLRTWVELPGHDVDGARAAANDRQRDCRRGRGAHSFALAIEPIVEDLCS